MRLEKQQELRNAIVETTNTLCDAVKSTLGPMGTNVGILSETMQPTILNDGVRVARAINFDNELSQYIAKILKQVSQNTDNLVHDGTTTSLTITQAIIIEAIKGIELKYKQRDINEGIAMATKDVINELEAGNMNIEDMLEKVATISANNDKELGSIIGKAFKEVGVDGQIDVEDSDSEKTYYEKVPGMKYSSGYESNLFSNTTKSTVEYKEARILIYEGKLKSVNESLLKVIQELGNDNVPIVIVADDYDKMAIDSFTGYKLNHGLQICAVRSPEYGSYKEGCVDDIAFISGANIISDRYGSDIDGVTIEDLGTVSFFSADQESFTVKNPDIDTSERVAQLKLEVKKLSGTYKDEVEMRIAKLSGGIAVLYVNGKSPIEIAEKKYRIEDAIGATRASLEEGIVPGGGLALYNISKSLKTPNFNSKGKEYGYELLIKAITAPIRTICENRGEIPEVILTKIDSSENKNYGYNAKTGEYGDMIEMGIIDPVKVTKAAIVNASSVSQMLINTNYIVY